MGFSFSMGSQRVAAIPVGGFGSRFRKFIAMCWFCNVGFQFVVSNSTALYAAKVPATALSLSLVPWLALCPIESVRNNQRVTNKDRLRPAAILSDCCTSPG